MPTFLVSVPPRFQGVGIERVRKRYTRPQKWACLFSNASCTLRRT